MRGVMALVAGTLSEAAGGFLQRDTAVNLDEPGAGTMKQRGNLFAFEDAAGPEIRFEDDLRAMRREGPEQVHRRRSDLARNREVVDRAVERGEEGLLDVVLGEEGETKRFGQRAGDGGLAGGWRSGDEDDAGVHDVRARSSEHRVQDGVIRNQRAVVRKTK